MQHMKSPFELPGKWYKANLHAHTTTSDGLLCPAERVEQYRKGGYDVIALTDHHTTNDVAGLSKRILVISGMEYHPACPTSPNSYHIIALNVPHGFAFSDGQNARQCIAEVASAGGISVFCHPYWTGQVYGDFEELRGIVAIEVYNSTCDGCGRGVSENEWASMLDRGWRLPAVATDDCHSADGEDIMRGWTWLKMPSLTVKDVLKAARTGACYSSRGPKIHDFAVKGGKVRLRCSPAAEIYFMGGPAQGARRLASKGKAITTFSIARPDWPFIRGVVVDAAGRRAWTNPIAPR